MTDLSSLLERVRGASGPSLVLDGEIWCAVNGYEFVQWDGAGCVYRDPNAPSWKPGITHASASVIRPYSASIDAAVALVERVLPSLDGQRRVRAERLIEQTMRNAGRDLAAGDQDIGGKAARGLCLAILTALADPADDAALLSALDTGSGR
ncbi:MAG: hypothetical protein JSS66_18895 [Armatimonadetes bacterium]|nr:hypothetical protein [Armatimonadota bacterium]